MFLVMGTHTPESRLSLFVPAASCVLEALLEQENTSRIGYISLESRKEVHGSLEQEGPVGGSLYGG